MTNPFSWDYLTAPLNQIETLGPFSTAFLVMFGLTFVVSAILYVTSGGPFGKNQTLRNAIRVGAQIMMWLTAIGLFFFAWRLMRIDFGTLYMRIWSYMFMGLFVLVIAYFIYWYRTSYRQRMHSIAGEAVRREYNPSGNARKRVRRKARRGVR